MEAPWPWPMATSRLTEWGAGGRAVGGLMDSVEKGTKLVALLLVYSTSPAPSWPHPCRAHTAPITSIEDGCWGRGVEAAEGLWKWSMALPSSEVGSRRLMA